MAEKFMTEVRRGQRKESIVSGKGFAKLGLEDPHTRFQIQQELEDIGITSHLFNQYHVLILQALTGATEKDLPQASAKTSARESYVAKALQKIKINRSSSKKPLSPGPSKAPTSGFEKSSIPDPSITTMPGITITSTPRPSDVKISPSGAKDDLFRAISRDDLARVEQLLDEGLDIESRDDANGGQTPLIVSVGYDKVDIAELLLLRGANANAKTYYTEETALISACASGRFQIILLILEHGNPDLEARDRNGRTALMRASAQGYGRQVEAVVKAGADLEARDKHNRTALMEAERFDHDQTVSLLIKLGAKNKQ